MNFAACTMPATLVLQLLQVAGVDLVPTSAILQQETRPSRFSVSRKIDSPCSRYRMLASNEPSRSSFEVFNRLLQTQAGERSGVSPPIAEAMYTEATSRPGSSGASREFLRRITVELRARRFVLRALPGLRFARPSW